MPFGMCRAGQTAPVLLVAQGRQNPCLWLGCRLWAETTSCQDADCPVHPGKAESDMEELPHVPGLQEPQWVCHQESC